MALGIHVLSMISDVTPHIMQTTLSTHVLSKAGVTYSFVKCGCLNYFFPQVCKSDMSRYGYLEVFQRVP